jgi:hypothetical protein
MITRQLFYPNGLKLQLAQAHLDFFPFNKATHLKRSNKRSSDFFPVTGVTILAGMTMTGEL